MRPLLLALVLTLAAGLPAAAAPADDVRLLERLLRDGDLAGARFTPAFRSRFPAQRVTAAIASIRAITGPPSAVRQTDEGYEIETATHTIAVRLERDPQGRIALLLFQPPVPRTADIDAALANLAALPGRAALVAVRNGKVVGDLRAGEALAVGSSFKLAVLAELTGAVAAGRHRWDETVRLEDRHRSLPSGIVQDWPDGTALTLDTLAVLMMRRSDNTATDMLVDVLGREAVAERLGVARFLTTREFFVLKADPQRATRWLRGEKLELAERPRPSVAQVLVPYRPGVEWHVPVRRLCRLATGLIGTRATADPRTLLSGVPHDAVMAKSGSEIGVVNHTVAWRRGSDTFCVSATVNGSPSEGGGAALAGGVNGVARLVGRD